MLIDININELKNKKDKLEKKDIDLIISDFDDTIFSRKDQLEDIELLRENRGNKGSDIIRNIIGIDNIMKSHYIDRDFPKNIVSKLRINHDLILTAGYKDIQEAKIKSCKLNHINYRIVDNAEDKILETIKYIVEELKFIPNKITIFEDRPKYFLEYKSYLEDFFDIEVEIMYVEMSDNISEPKIKKLEV